MSPGWESSQHTSLRGTGFPAGFTCVLDIGSTIPFAALTLRSLMNVNNDFLMTTFPIADANQTAPSPVIFPHVVDGGGYQTEFILISAGQASNTKLKASKAQKIE